MLQAFLRVVGTVYCSSMPFILFFMAGKFLDIAWATHFSDSEYSFSFCSSLENGDENDIFHFRYGRK